MQTLNWDAASVWEFALQKSGEANKRVHLPKKERDTTAHIVILSRVYMKILLNQICRCGALVVPS